MQSCVIGIFQILANSITICFSVITGIYYRVDFNECSNHKFFVVKGWGIAFPEIVLDSQKLHSFCGKFRFMLI